MKGLQKIIAISIMAISQVAIARDDWYEPELSLEGNVAVGTIAPRAGQATVHVRMKASQWSLSWPSGYGYCKATLILPPKGRKDDVYFTSSKLLLETGDRVEEYRVDGDVSCDDFNSMKIDYDGVTATLYVGDAVAREVAAVPFGSGEVLVDVPAGSLCQRMQLVQQAEDTDAGVLEGSLERMLLRVSDSEDHNEGIWEYFGKDADAAKVNIGGRYVLATVANGHDGYDIVYVAGAETNAGKWRPMRLKGRMRPTIFADDYDLEWIDAAGTPVAGDTYARMSGDRSLLTFGFPDYGATLRFRRVRQSDIIQKAGL